MKWSLSQRPVANKQPAKKDMVVVTRREEKHQSLNSLLLLGGSRIKTSCDIKLGLTLNEGHLDGEKNL